jgi:hypothetical protein
MSSENIYYCYALFRLDDGSTCYIGKGKGQRMNHHGWTQRKHRNVYLGRIILKHGIAAVRIRDGLTEAEAFETERAFIAALGRHPNGPLVNLTDGGEGPAGMKYSDEHRARLSAARKGVPKSETHRNNMRIARLGKKAVAEQRAKQGEGKSANKASISTREKMSASQKARWADPEHRAKMLSPEMRRSISDRNRRRGQSEESRAKIAQARTGTQASDETRRKMSETHKARWASKRAQAAE